MKFFARAPLFALAWALGAVAACGSGSHPTSRDVASDVTQHGQVSMRLSLPGGVTIDTVSYDVMGPTPQTGAVPVGSAQDIQFVVSDLAPGDYTIELTATDSNLDPCSGSGAFTVTPGAMTGVSIAMQCLEEGGTPVAAPVNMGSVFVDASATLLDASVLQCPGIASFNVSPAAVPVGSSATVSVDTVGAPPTIQWTQTDAPGMTGAGTFADATAVSTTFTCTQAGQAIVTVSVATGACSRAPFTTMFADVTCEGSPEAGADAAEASVAGPSPCPSFNAGLGCTPTEQLFVDRDKTNGCYDCMVQGGCLDDAVFMDTGHECGDVGTPTQQTACLDMMSCLLGTGCANSTGSVAACYCGTSSPTSTCQGNPAAGPIDGVCANAIATALGFPVSDGTDNTKGLTDITLPGGVAAHIWQCARNNACSSCMY
jgi:hypothetical protein